MKGVAVTLLASAAALTAGCGGGGGGSSTTSPAQFRTQVSQLCANAQKQINAVPKPQSVKDVPPYLDKTLAIAQPYVDKLDAVDPPSQLESPFNQVVSINKQELDLLKKTKSSLSSNPVAALKKLQRQSDALSQTENARWRQLGVTQCAS
jgi:hypothetical protein